MKQNKKVIEYHITQSWCFPDPYFIPSIRRDFSLYSRTAETINGNVKDHLEYYAWRRENVMLKDEIGIHKPEIFFRLVAKPKRPFGTHYIVTAYVTKRIWKKAQTEDGSIYTLGKEVPIKDIDIIRFLESEENKTDNPADL